MSSWRRHEIWRRGFGKPILRTIYMLRSLRLLRRGFVYAVGGTAMLCHPTTRTSASDLGQGDPAVLPTGSQTAYSTNKPLLRDFIGLNGHTVNFKPELY